ncbi:MAG TPA: serine/threonine-protein kinase, partial [Ktedonobacterales bacterium]|nr:serine/threonine-protein kinase [Ktedonobacterales bacterium]
MNIGPQRPEALLGQVIAGYELVEYIGTGATGLVFRGRLTDAPIVEKTNFKPPLLPDEAAIKLLVPPIGSTQKELDEFHSRFRLEARVLSELDYSSILRVLAYGDDAASGMSYMILPFMAGGSLASVIAERGPLPLPEVARILTPIAAALDYAHRHNVVHRDVKPGNILLDATGAPALSDFSIVRLLSEGGSMRTTTGRMMGTPAYMSPEQFDDSSKVGPAADIYGLGMVAYEMVTGRAAFASTSWAQAMRQQLQAAPPEPRTLRPDLPEPAQAAILRALEKDPARRFPTATA